MTDRPIIFSAPMVRALLEGRKSQTRRVLKPQPEAFETSPGIECKASVMMLDGVPRLALGCDKAGVVTLQRLPYAPGDRLWVKETYTYVGTTDPGWLLYRATYDECCARHGFDKEPPPQSEVGWKPSIYMPRRLSRLTLLVTNVRVQRLQEISEADILAEGAPLDPYHRDGTLDGSNPVMCLGPTPHHRQSPRAWFHRLWNSLHGPEAWDQNPWVCALTFDTVRANIEEVRA